jgi:hypothetical protein
MVLSRKYRISIWRTELGYLPLKDVQLGRSLCAQHRVRVYVSKNGCAFLDTLASGPFSFREFTMCARSRVIRLKLRALFWHMVKPRSYVHPSINLNIRRENHTLRDTVTWRALILAQFRCSVRLWTRTYARPHACLSLIFCMVTVSMYAQRWPNLAGRLVKYNWEQDICDIF